MPYAVLCLALWREGTFPRFWFWTVTLARAFATETQIAGVWMNLRDGLREAVRANLFLWLLAVAGIAVAFRNGRHAQGGVVVRYRVSFGSPSLRRPEAESSAATTSF